MKKQMSGYGRRAVMYSLAVMVMMVFGAATAMLNSFHVSAADHVQEHDFVEMKEYHRVSRKEPEVVNEGTRKAAACEDAAINTADPQKLYDLEVESEQTAETTETTSQVQVMEQDYVEIKAEQIDAPKTEYEEVELPVDYLGRFSVPDVGVNVGCYESSAQAVADAHDSAAYFNACGHTVIADHVNQGFGAIKGCSVGDTAQLTTEKGTETYICVGSIQGHNTGTELTDANYTPIDDLYPDTLACYTCNDNWQNVTIVFFAPESIQTPEPTPSPAAPVQQEDTELSTKIEVWEDGTTVAIGPTLFVGDV